MIKVKRGDVFLANLSDATGSEQAFVRPVVIIQNNCGNKHSPTTIVACLSSKIESKAHLPTHYILPEGIGLKHRSMVLCEQIKVIDKARALLERYDYKMPFVSNQKYNLYLKAVAKHAGITKRLTSHMARHTFATSALHNGIPIEVVSKMLSHADIGTTQLYAKVLADDVMAAFDKLNESK